MLRNRRILQNIIDARDPRLFVVVGPCSVHDVAAAMEYAKRLKPLADALSDTLVLVMRVYFEKPRTTVGWKGLINDPDMDDSFHIEKGIGDRPQAAARPGRTRPADGYRGAGPDHAAVSRRPDYLERDRCAHD